MADQTLPRQVGVFDWRAAMRQIRVPYQYIAFFGEEVLDSILAIFGMSGQMPSPIVMRLLPILGRNPMFSVPTKIPVGQSMATRDIHQFA